MKAGETWMPLYVGDYLADTGHLNTEQHGAYLLLLMQYWRTGPLPNVDRQLAAIARVTRVHWDRFMAPVILPLFIVGEDGRLTHKRVDSERAIAQHKSTKRAAAGRTGGKNSAQKRAKSRTENEGFSAPETSEIAPLVDNENNGVGLANGQANTEQCSVPSPSPSPLEVRKESATQIRPPDPLGQHPDLLGDVVPTAKVLAMPKREAEEAVALWNDLARELGLPAVQHLSDDRRRRLVARLKEAGGIEGWKAALAEVRSSSHLRGETPGKGGARSWCCNFDFLTSLSGFTKIMEGNYRDRDGGSSGNAVTDALNLLRRQGGGQP
jgi:uncharacterized protein YdaU (DUF1376 family)